MTNETKAKYAEWRTLTDEERYEKGLPLTQREFSTIYSITEQTLSAWNKELDAKKPKEANGIHNLEDFLGYMRSLAFNPKSLGKDRELYAKLLGWLTEKREDTVKVEFTPADYTRIARETIGQLRAELESGGGRCPVCGQYKALRNGARLDTESEHTEDREVAALALPPRPE